jgi:predicted flavoprotein YhiN
LRSRLGLEGAKAGLLRECTSAEVFADPTLLAAHIKALPIYVRATRPIDEAISSAGGVELHNLTDQLMLTNEPGIFCAGEMLDWEAPTGGYLLTACFSTGLRAALGIEQWLQNRTIP